MQRLLLSLLLCAACGDNVVPAGLDGGPPRDAAAGSDAAIPRDGAPPLAWVDFTAGGCDFTLANPDAGPRCSGFAPLTVTFEPLSPSPIDEYRWRFGDETDDKTTEPAAQPVHTYAQTGLYDVSLSASGAGGSGSAVKSGFIEVLPAPASRPCTADEQCQAGQCICKDDDCAPAFAVGLCAASCDPETCPEGTVAAELSPVDTADQDWEQCLCLQDCSTLGCPSGTSCQDLKSTSGWSRACLPAGLLAPIGASCQSLDD
ncbi:MAG: PKD domain-containing protein, partial [Deltaproteobacteria bacterium]|nr:PKD domain-containing protein [Deltaproteobacteria bacterium]